MEKQKNEKEKKDWGGDSLGGGGEGTEEREGIEGEGED